MLPPPLRLRLLQGHCQWQSRSQCQLPGWWLLNYCVRCHAGVGGGGTSGTGGAVVAAAREGKVVRTNTNFLDAHIDCARTRAPTQCATHACTHDSAHARMTTEAPSHHCSSFKREDGRGRWMGDSPFPHSSLQTRPCDYQQFQNMLRVRLLGSRCWFMGVHSILG